MYSIRTSMTGTDNAGREFSIAYGQEYERAVLESYGIDPDRLVETGQAVVASETATKGGTETAAQPTAKKRRKPRTAD